MFNVRVIVLLENLVFLGTFFLYESLLPFKIIISFVVFLQI